MSKQSGKSLATIKAGDSLISEAEREAVGNLSTLLANARTDMLAAQDDPIQQAMIQAKAMRMLDTYLTPAIMADTMELMNSDIGFQTDRPQKGKGPYTVEEVKQPLIVAMLTGLRPVNNEFNVIAGKCYATKNGVKRIVNEWPGLTDLQIDLEVPQNSTSGSGALVGATAKWRLDGNPMELSCQKTSTEDTRIPVKVNAMMGIDAIHGKATRKLYARILERLSGSAHTIETVDDAEDRQTSTVETFDAREHATRLTVDAWLQMHDFQNCDTITEVRDMLQAVEESLIDVDATPEAKHNLAQGAKVQAEQRIDEIRQRRGPRTNQQGSKQEEPQASEGDAGTDEGTEPKDSSGEQEAGTDAPVASTGELFDSYDNTP